MMKALRANHFDVIGLSSIVPESDLKNGLLVQLDRHPSPVTNQEIALISGNSRRAIGGCKAPAMKTLSDLNFPERVIHSEGVSRSSDRAFGLIFTVFWSIVAVAPLRKGGSIRAWAIVLAAAFLLIASSGNSAWTAESVVAEARTIVAKAHQSHRDGGPVLFDHSSHLHL